MDTTTTSSRAGEDVSASDRHVSTSKWLVAADQAEQWVRSVAAAAFRCVRDRNRRARLIKLCDERLLRVATKHARAGRSRDDRGRRLIELSAADLEQIVQELASSLQSGTYFPGRCRRRLLRKSGGGHRTLRTPSARDTVVQHALLLILEPVIEATLSWIPVGARPGKSLPMAINRLVSAIIKNPGPLFLVKVDVAACFDELDHLRLLALLRERVRGAEPALNVLMAQLAKWNSSGRGVPQGAPLSPALCNVFLSSIDQILIESDVVLVTAVRWLDDLIIICRSPEDAAKIVAEVEAAVENIGLRVNEKKTVVVSVDEGLDVLGFVIRRTASDRVSVTVQRKKIEAYIATIDRARKKGISPKSEEGKALIERVLGFVQHAALFDLQAAEEVHRHLERTLNITVRMSGQTTETGAKGAEEGRTVVGRTSDIRPITDGTSPGRTGAAQERSPLGQRYIDPQVLAKYPRSFAYGNYAPQALDNRALGDLRTIVLSEADYLGPQLHRTQGAIAKACAMRRLIRVSLMKESALKESEAERLLASSEEHETLLSSERKLRQEARLLNFLLRRLHGIVRDIDHEMERRLKAAGVVPVPGMLHQLRSPR